MLPSPTLRRLTPPASIVCTLAFGVAAADAQERCTAATAVPLAGALERSASAVTCEINRVREARGLPALNGDPRLAGAAARHARHMVRRRYFSHVTPRGRRLRDRLAAAGYVTGRVRWSVGETLAWGTYRFATPAHVVEAWMNSPEHRRVLLGRHYRDLGVGLAIGTPRGPSLAAGATYAAEFGALDP